MNTEIIQVRDVPTEDVEKLRERANARNLSLSGYLRELIHAETSRPTTSDVIDRIATRDSIEASTEDIRSFIEYGRR